MQRWLCFIWRSCVCLLAISRAVKTIDYHFVKIVPKMTCVLGQRRRHWILEVICCWILQRSNKIRHFYDFAYTSENIESIFMIILSEMYLVTRKSPLYCGSHPVLSCLRVLLLVTLFLLKESVEWVSVVWRTCTCGSVMYADSLLLLAAIIYLVSGVTRGGGGPPVWYPPGVTPD